ncbi:class I SAM-dependent methyltransferase [Streptomyces cyaneofuscatus]|uniref:class I SAM-dependent methyltransferase n=1 Tax=Streptomyces cyaneofuscatus TaxID=66883 RepID=UPI0037994266
MITQSSPWHAYAAQITDRPTGRLPVPRRLQWTTHPATGPGAEAFGISVRGRHLLELGCGPGHSAAYLAGRERAHVTAVDLVDLQIRRSREHYGHLPDVTYLTCEALRFLRHSGGRFDAVYSIFGAIGLTDPAVLLPAVARRLNQHRPLVFSVPHPHRRTGTIPTTRAARPRADVLALPDGTRHPLVRWELDVAQWSTVLARNGFRLSQAQEFTDPRRPRSPATLLITARRV